MKWIIRKGLWMVVLVILAFTVLMPAAPVLAAHEVSNFTMSSAPPQNAQSKWTNNIEISWDAPTMGSDILLNYIYLWNNVSTAMNDTDFNDTTGTATSNRVAVKNATDLTAKDFSLNPQTDVLYLHVKTRYDNGTTVVYSTDNVLGAFQIDNVAPGDGTIRIVDSSGNTITETSSTNVNVRLAASGSIGKYYLSETESSPGTGTSPFATDVVWGLQDTATGSHTLYAWFEDPAGNQSRPATVTFTLLSAISITPFTATIDLASPTPTQTFKVDGSTATDYTWSISDSTVAQITGSATGNSVTVTGLKTGTFTLTATKASDSSVLTSGTITVVQSVKLGDVNGDGIVDVSDVIKIVRASLDLSNASPYIAAAADINLDGIVDVSDVIKAVRLSLDLSI